MSRRRKAPELPTPYEVTLAPGDLVVLVPKRNGPMVFGEVCTEPGTGAPVQALVPGAPSSHRSRRRHPYRRAWLSSYRILAVDRGGSRIAKVLEPPAAQLHAWGGQVPEHPGRIGMARYTSRALNAVSREWAYNREHRMWVSKGEVSASAPETLGGTKGEPGLDATCVVKYAHEVGWGYTIIRPSGTFLFNRKPFKSADAAMRACATRLASLPSQE